jgi:hypothetical protein
MTAEVQSKKQKLSRKGREGEPSFAKDAIER